MKKTPCIIRTSRVEVDLIRTGVDAEWDAPYEAKILYTYLIDGREHVGRTVAFSQSKTSSATEAHAVCRRYSPGMQTFCYVNPASPDDVLLEKPSLFYIAILFVTLLSITARVLWDVCLPAWGLRERQPAYPNKDPKRIRQLIAGTVLFGASLIGWIQLWGIPLAAQIRSRSWHPVSCRVVGSNYLFMIQLHRPIPFYRTDIYYTYDFNGVTYYSNRYKATEGWSVGGPLRKSVIARYPAGSMTTCYVDPAKPEDAVLSTTISPTWLNAGFVFGVVLFGTYLMGLALLGDRWAAGWPTRFFGRLFAIWLFCLIVAQFLPP